MRRRSPGTWVSFGGVILGLGLMGATMTLPSARAVLNGTAGARLSTKNALSPGEDARYGACRKPRPALHLPNLGTSTGLSWGDGFLCRGRTLSAATRPRPCHLQLDWLSGLTKLQFTWPSRRFTTEPRAPQAVGYRMGNWH
jgi:hypothetical protein